MTETNLCRHGFSIWHGMEDCKELDLPNGATVTDLHELDRFTVGSRTMIVVNPVHNQRGLVNRVVNIDSKPYKIIGFEWCLIPGHDTGHACKAGTVVSAVKEVDSDGAS